MNTRPLPSGPPSTFTGEDRRPARGFFREADIETILIQQPERADAVCNRVGRGGQREVRLDGFDL
ncbi:MAG: hypothetical protein SH809_12305 [Rhodothermales bacterium]|nr:hypothetical protein [Rhodothermales bacterium]